MSARTGSLFWLDEVTHRRFKSLEHKAVMWALVQHVDGADQCFPGQVSIAAFIQRSERKVRGVLAELEADGLIRREHRHKEQGRRTSDLIVLVREAILGLPESLPAQRAGRADPYRHSVPVGVRSNRHGTPVQPARDAGPTGTLVPDNNPVLEQPSIEHMSSPSGDDDTQGHVEDLCTYLADRVEAHGKVGRPIITARWRTDMRLLLERGPLHVEGAEPVTAPQARSAIAFVFDRLADPEGRGGFCWADQVRSPSALRDHFVQLRQAARRSGGMGRLTAEEARQARQAEELRRLHEEALRDEAG